MSADAAVKTSPTTPGAKANGPGADQALAGLLQTLTALEGWLQQSSLEELEVEHAGQRLRLKKPGVATNFIPAAAPAPAVAAAPAAPIETGHTYKAQLVGTFYAASSPEAAPFVQVGTAVKVGQVLGIIEAMKTMNQLTADVEGTVQKVLVKNGQAVEFGQPLFVIA